MFFEAFKDTVAFQFATLMFSTCVSIWGQRLHLLVERKPHLTLQIRIRDKGLSQYGTNNIA